MVAKVALADFVAGSSEDTGWLVDGRPVATGLLAMDAPRVSVLIEQWRAQSNKGTPLTYAEFKAVMAGDLTPSASIRAAWGRRKLNRARVADTEAQAYLAARKADLFLDLTELYEREAQTLLRRFAGAPVSARLYARYLASCGRDVQRAFFRRWALPFPEDLSIAHSYGAAGSEQGKTEYTKAVIFERVRRREGVMVFDPHGDMAWEIAHWPEVVRSGRLIYLDPFLEGPDAWLTPVINPLEALQTHPYKEAALSAMVQCLQRVVDKAELSTHMATLLRSVLPALASKPHVSLADLWQVLGNPKKQDTRAALEWLAQQAGSNPRNAAFIAHDLTDGDYNSTRQAIRSRLQYLLSSQVFTRCVSGRSTLDLRKAMDNGAIVVVNLSGKMGQGIAQDWGKFLLASLFNAAISRQDLPKELRRPFFAYLDEADAFLNESVSEIYAQTRKFGLYMQITQQVPGANMSPLMESQVLGNSRIRFAGNSGDPASLRKMAAYTDAPEEALRDLRRGEFLFRLPPKLYRARVRRDLLGSKHSISEAEWEREKARQLALYYRDHRQPGQAGASVTSYAASPYTPSPFAPDDPPASSAIDRSDPATMAALRDPE